MDTSVGGSATSPRSVFPVQSGTAGAPASAGSAEAAGVEAVPEGRGGGLSEATADGAPGRVGGGSDGRGAGFGAQPTSSRTRQDALLTGPTVAPLAALCEASAMRAGWLLLSLLLLACEDPPTADTCGALPDPSACPAARGGTCEDRSCTALYACREGRWTLVETCPESTGGAGGASGAAGQGGNQGGASCTEPAPSACLPLQKPDCDAALIEACPAEACALGCEGFLRCEGADWSETYEAYCDENGELITP